MCENIMHIILCVYQKINNTHTIKLLIVNECFLIFCLSVWNYASDSLGERQNGKNQNLEVG